MGKDLDRRTPDPAELLRERPELDVDAIDELLRYNSPVQMSRRITLAPYEVGGHTIPTGSFRAGRAGLGQPGRVVLGSGRRPGTGGPPERQGTPGRAACLSS
ncbi:MAG: hypothetical protein ACR2G2_12140 [Pseudonocardia sp.]